MLGCESFVAMLTEVRLRLRLMWLVVMNNHLRLLCRRSLRLILLNDLNRTDRRLLLLTRDSRVDNGRLLRHLSIGLRLMLLLKH